VPKLHIGDELVFYPCRDALLDSLIRPATAVSYPALLAADGACLLLAVTGRESQGYLLGFRHLTFCANGPVGWVEEIGVGHQARGQGIGRDLMDAFEQWAAEQGCALVALATRRAAPFYRALDMRSLPPTSARYWSARRGPRPAHAFPFMDSGDLLAGQAVITTPHRTRCPLDSVNVM
jgi:GNAT superfamily N-acetyltransferase